MASFKDLSKHVQKLGQQNVAQKAAAAPKAPVQTAWKEPTAPAAGSAQARPAQPLAPVGQVEKNPMFDLQRKRAEQGLAAAGQQQNDAIQRRFAAMGGLNSGAFIKAQEGARDAAMSQKQSAMEAIDASETADVSRQKEILSGREFARGERLGSQDFSSSERQGSQSFAASQAGIGREFQAQQQAEQQKFQGYLADRQHQLALESLDLEKQAFQFNKDQAEYDRNNQPGGLLGTGILGKEGILGLDSLPIL